MPYVLIPHTSSYLLQLLAVQPPLSTHSTLGLTLHFLYITSALAFSNRAISIAVPPLLANSRKYCDKYLIRPTNSAKHRLLLSLHRSFTHVKTENVAL